MSTECAACKKAFDAAEKPTKDKKGRLYHAACAQKLIKQHRERQAAAAAAQQPNAIMDSLLSGVEKATAVTCPSCANMLAEGTTLCTRCGHNFVTGKGTRTQVEKQPSAAKAAAGNAASTSMGWTFALIGSGIGGGVGACIWSAVAYFLHAEVGYVAWGVGGLAGLGAAIGARQHIGMLTGLVAAVVAIASVFGGKFMAAKFVSADIASEIRAEARQVSADDPGVRDAMIVTIADQIAFEREETGEQLAWPEGITYDDAFELKHYPAEIVADATSRWDAMSPTHRNAMARQDSELLASFIESDAGTALALGASYGGKDVAFDVLWIVLAAGTAFGIGVNGIPDGD